MKGILELHGVKQERTLSGQIKVVSYRIELFSEFVVKLTDHQIEVPTVVFAKIAEQVLVKNHFIVLEKK